MNINQLSRDRLLETLKSDMQKILEDEFLQKPVGKDVINSIGLRIDSYMRALVEDQGFHKEIEFEVTGILDDSRVNVVPGNFFTGLLMQGIYYPPALYGANELETNIGKYVWDSSGQFGLVTNTKEDESKTL